MTYTVDRIDGAQTNFGFVRAKTEERESEAVLEILQDLLPKSELESVSMDSVCKDLRNGDTVTGWWFSSDSDVAMAANDIQTRIASDTGLKVRLTMFDSMGHEITGERQNGQFLATKLP